MKILRNPASTAAVALAALLLISCAGDNSARGGVPGSGKPDDPSGANAGSSGSGFDNSDAGPTETLVIPEPGSEDLTEDNCGVEQFILQAKNPVDIHIVLDKSESMGSGWSGGAMQTRWENVKDVLEDVLTGLQDKIRFGLALYPWAPDGSCNCFPGYSVDPADDTMCCTDMTCIMCVEGHTCNTVEYNVEVAAFNAGPIIEAMDATMPAGSTPTRHAVLDATRYMENLASPNPKYLLLATDGAPNCRAGYGTMEEVCPLDSTRDDDDWTNPKCCRAGVCDVPKVYNEEVDTVKAIQAAADKGIKTYVVGMALQPALESYDDILSYSVNQGAVHGGTARADGPPYYYPVEDGDELKQALLEIAGQLIGCDYYLEAEPPDPGNLLLVVNGMEIPRDSANGFELSGPDSDGRYTIGLNGPACDAIKGAPAAAITLYLGCPGEPIPSPL